MNVRILPIGGCGSALYETWLPRSSLTSGDGQFSLRIPLTSKHDPLVFDRGRHLKRFERRSDLPLASADALPTPSRVTTTNPDTYSRCWPKTNRHPHHPHHQEPEQGTFNILYRHTNTHTQSLSLLFESLIFILDP